MPASERPARPAPHQTFAAPPIVYASPSYCHQRKELGVSLKSLYIGKRRGAVMREGDFKRYAETKLKTYIDSDKKAGRHDGTEGAYSLVQISTAGTVSMTSVRHT